MTTDAIEELIETHEPKWMTHPDSFWNRVRRELAALKGETISPTMSWNPETQAWEL